MKYPSPFDIKILSALSLFTVGISADAAGQSVAEFYNGKQVRLVVGSDAASTYNLYGRTVTRHMSKHVPGNPIFVTENMPGAGGRVSANWLYNVAPKNGLALATFSQSIPIDQVRTQDRSQFDVAKFNWIGNPFRDTEVTLSWSPSGLTTIDDVKSKGGLICGSTGGSGPQNTYPHIINNLAGTQICVVAGYSGQGPILLALQRGEVNCVQGTWTNIKTVAANLLEEKKLAVLVQWDKESNAEIASYMGRGVPLIGEYVKTDLDRKVIDLIQSSYYIGRPLVAPPAIPEDRVTALRRGFDATMKDAEFIAEAKKLNLAITPLSGEGIQKVAVDMTRMSDDVVKRLDQITVSSTSEKSGKN